MVLFRTSSSPVTRRPSHLEVVPSATRPPHLIEQHFFSNLHYPKKHLDSPICCVSNPYNINHFYIPFSSLSLIVHAIHLTHMRAMSQKAYSEEAMQKELGSRGIGVLEEEQEEGYTHLTIKKWVEPAENKVGKTGRAGGEDEGVTEYVEVGERPKQAKLREKAKGSHCRRS